jgi:multidrug efflux pump subunit AcrA (membrane-fusion protein)
MKTRNFYWIVPLMIISSITSSCKDERETYTVKKGDVVESVYSSVVLEPEEMYKVNASIPGYIDQIAVRVGDTVVAGQPLFFIRDITSANTANNARLALDLAEKNYKGDLNLIADMKLDLQNADVKRKNDSIQYQKFKKLFDKQLITATEMDQVELAYTASKNNYQALRNKIRRAERELKISMEQARNNLNSSQSRSEESTVRNRINGIVYDIQKEQGEYVSMQEPVAIVGSASNFLIKMLIDEIDITKVKIGQRIIVSLEAFSDRTFEATVTRIAPRMDTRTQTFEVEGTFNNIHERLYFGLTGEASIVVAKKKNSVVIPREYIIGSNEVETVDGMKKVKIGTISLSHAEILEGLKEGDVIYKPM